MPSSESERVARRPRVRAPAEGDVVGAVRASCQALGMRATRVLVAISGGVDSSVLLHALAALAPELELTLGAGHVHHGLRGAAADADAACAASLARAVGVPLAVRRVDPRSLRAKAAQSRTRPTLQEAARTLRAAALRDAARELRCELIATAHTLDDQAETVLMRLFRGASPAALGGIAERSEDGCFVRPLLWVSRAAIERYARERRLSWREDASNRDPRTARGRLRTSGIFEIARQLNPEWLRAVSQLAEAQRKESAWLDEQVKRETQHWNRAEPGRLALPRSAFAELDDALARRVVRYAIRELGGARDLSRAHIERSLAFLRGARAAARLDLPGGLRWRAAGGECWLERSASELNERC